MPLPLSMAKTTEAAITAAKTELRIIFLKEKIKMCVDSLWKSTRRKNLRA